MSDEPKTLYKAIKLFTEEAPEGYEASVIFEKSYCWVSFKFPNGCTKQILGGSLVEMVLRALEIAKEDYRKVQP
jgi:hypothetical protein